MELRHSASHKATILPALALLKLAIILFHAFSKVGACLDREREALNTFRKALHDPSGLLSSWDQGEDCCKWRGVSCDNDTGYVMKLDLHSDAAVDSSFLSGRIDPALLELKYLQFLDLSYNDFGGSSVPSFLWSMKELRHLNLSWTGLRGRIPHQLGNLSNLVSLQLSSNGLLSADKLGWLRNMTSLEYLDMSGVNLSLASHRWVHVIMNGCPSLVELRLPNCQLSFIPSSLSFLNFSSLRVLDISYNDFDSIIPNWIGNISSLVSLDLTFNEFHGRVPFMISELPVLEELSIGAVDDNLAPDWSEIFEGSWNKLKTLLLISGRGSIPESIENITSLVSLTLSVNDCSIPYGLARLKKFGYLVMSDCRLSGPIPAFLGGLSSLRKLDLSNNQWNGTIPETLRGLSSLEELNLGGNQLSGPIPVFLGGLSSLQKLDLSYNQWNGTIPETLGGLSSLEELNLQGNQLSGSIPETLGGLSFLEELNLKGNQLSGPIPAFVGELSSLQKLDLSYNQWNGTIPETLGGLSSLEELYLQGNQLNGNIPTALGQLSNLTYLHMSGNFLTGNVSEAHFENLRELNRLVLDGNPLVMDLQPHWIPPFQLVQLSLKSVNVGPRFPLWLRTQKMFGLLDISNASISDVIPTWLWDITANVWLLKLSHNMLSGQLPNTLEMMNYQFLDLSWNFLNGSIPCIKSSRVLDTLDLSNNQFSGPLPTNCTYPYSFFSASSNRISGTIPTSICKMSSVAFLDLSNNSLSGTIPETIGNCTSLSVLDLSDNHLSGNIPRSMGSLIELDTLHLDSNGLSGELPSSLKNCSSLVALDLRDNKFYGKIPSWIGKSFTGLRILSLRGNLFTGGIPPQLLHISSLQIFDVAGNRLRGPIPTTFEDLRAMKNETHDDLTYNGIGFTNGFKAIMMDYRENLIISTKGQTLTYTKTISLLTCIDLSSNNFSGEIPDALTTLSGLNVLNLSGNHLIGNIPSNIGRLAMLESLDLSRNELSGIIPQSISNLYFLSYLNLSHNNLSGRIPYGKQLQTLIDPTIYAGNAGLCGFPLADCGGKGQDGKNHSGEGNRQDEKDHVMFWFYVGIGPGFVVGFWTICGILILKKSWRIAYFRLVDEMADKFYIFVMRWMARLKQKMADGNKICWQ